MPMYSYLINIYNTIFIFIKTCCLYIVSISLSQFFCLINFYLPIIHPPCHGFPSVDARCPLVNSFINYSHTIFNSL